MKLGSKVIEFRVMAFVREILGLLLIAALGMATLAPGPLTAASHASRASTGLLAGPRERPAGCHAHGGKSLPDSRLPQSPQPAPASYQCCLTGHDVAVVQSTHFPQPSGQGTRLALRVEPALCSFSVTDLKVAMVLTTDPPGSPPLRI